MNYTEWNREDNFNSHKLLELETQTIFQWDTWLYYLPSGVDISIPDLSPSLEVYNSYFPQDIVYRIAYRHLKF